MTSEEKRSEYADEAKVVSVRHRSVDRTQQNNLYELVWAMRGQCSNVRFRMQGKQAVIVKYVGEPNIRYKNHREQRGT